MRIKVYNLIILSDLSSITTSSQSIFRMLENFTPKYDATPCKRLQDAGTILLGKTNLDEFSMGSGAIDSIFGSTKNVWKSKSGLHIAGGSSGGSAVAVATGSCFA